MKLKHLLFASAAAMVATSAAQAADLGVVEPVEYVKVCDAYGTGYFYIPGTQTCLKIGGYMRADYNYTSPQDSTTNRNTENYTSFTAKGLVSFTANTDTEYGLLRSYVAFVMYSDNSSELDAGYIQFGGLTAGHATSFFDFVVAGTLINSPFYSDDTVDLLAYTASFGNGITATISIEDYRDRDPVNYGIPLNGYVDPVTGALLATSDYAGYTMPDIVGNIRVDQGWGSFSLSGAIHEVRPDWAVAGSVLDPTGTLYQADSEYGFAIQAGLKVNLPQVAEGDYVWVVGGYSSGAPAYLLGDAPILPYRYSNAAPLVDAVVSADGDVELTDIWAINGGFVHYFTPNVWAAGTVGYADFDQSYNAALGVEADFSAIIAEGSLYWSPVKDLTLAVSASYTSFDYDDGVALPDADDDIWQGRFRIQRNF